MNIYEIQSDLREKIEAAPEDQREIFNLLIDYIDEKANDSYDRIKGRGVYDPDY